MPKRKFFQEYYEQAEARERRRRATQAAYAAAQARASHNVYDIVLANQGRNSPMFYQPHRQQWREEQRRRAARRRDREIEHMMLDYY